MKNFIFGFCILLGASTANAQTFKVLRAKGNKAVIQLPKGESLAKGSTYSISESRESSASAGGNGSREKTVSLSSEIFTGSRSVGSGSSVSLTTFDVAGRYGWNQGVMEYGPLASVAYASSGSASARTILAGGFYDYNLVENTPDTELVYGVGASAALGQASVSAGGSSSTSSTILTASGGGQAKWFPFGHSTAIRVDGGLRFDRQKTGTVTTTETGLTIAAGLQVYF